VSKGAWLILCAACGRIGFEPLPDGGVSDGAAGDALASGLLLDFEFESDGLLHDRTGNHDATCLKCPTATTDPRGGVASFDGTECLAIADAADLHPPQFTATAWFWMAAGTFGDPFVRPYNTAASNNTALELNITFNHISLGVNQMFINVLPPPVGEWHHVAGVFDGNVATLYYDAARDGPTLAPGPVNYFAGDSYYIGCDVNTGGQTAWWTGMLDAVRFYDHALTQAEITADMAQ
jgi:hypothetical protein